MLSHSNFYHVQAATLKIMPPRLELRNLGSCSMGTWASAHSFLLQNDYKSHVEQPLSPLKGGELLCQVFISPRDHDPPLRGPTGLCHD